MDAVQGFIELTQHVFVLPSVGTEEGDEHPPKRVLIALHAIERVEAPSPQFAHTRVHYRNGPTTGTYNVLDSYEDVRRLIQEAAGITGSE